METCGHYQAQLLDYLYDLLEDEDHQALKAHLEQCGPCQAGLTQAQGQRRLLASAARMDFSTVRFEAPPARTVVPAEATPTSAARSSLGVGSLLAVAACLLLALGTLGVPGYWYLQEKQAEHLDQKATADLARIAQKHHEQIGQAARELRETDRKLQELPQLRQEKLDAVARAAGERQLNLVVSGPKTLQPGAPNPYQIETLNLSNQRVASRLDINVVVRAKETREPGKDEQATKPKAKDNTDKVVYQAKDVASTGVYQLNLPPQLPVEPNAAVVLEVVAKNEGVPRGELRESLELARPLYLTHLTTDKPMYRPGETVHFRSLTLERFSLKPAEDSFHVVYSLMSPRGEETEIAVGNAQLLDPQSPISALLMGPDRKPIQGIGAGEIQLNSNFTGGEYTLKVTEADGRFPTQERKFIINEYEPPHLNKELDFDRKSYGAGEEVIASCRVSRVEGGQAVAKRRVEATIHVDGKNFSADGKQSVQPAVFQTDDKGAVSVRFKLPANIERGEGSLSVKFDDGANTETMVRTIPIVAKKLRVDFYAEGGDLVNGLLCRVYFQARTLLDKPAELTGRIIDQDGEVVVKDVHTLNDAENPGVNQGLGVFDFTPSAGHKYELKIDSPIGIVGSYPLPASRDDGVVLSVRGAVTGGEEPMRVVVHSAVKERSLLVGAYCRGRLMAQQSVKVRANEPAEVELKPAQGIGGVYRVTVFEEREQADKQRMLTPLAERLVYRLPAEHLNMTIQPDKQHYIPGDRVGLRVSAADEKGEPAPAILLLAVVDKRILTLADEKTARAMPTHFYLTTEVRRPEDLEYADFLVSPHPKAKAALDLLLGTQGWRRFAEQNPLKFRQQPREQRDRDDAERLLVMSGQAMPERTDLLQQEMRKVQAEHDLQQARLQEKLAQSQKALENAQNDKTYPEAMSSLHEEKESARTAALANARKLDQFRSIGLPILGVVLMVITVVALVLALSRGLARAVPYYATAACSLLFCGGVIVLAMRGIGSADLSSVEVASITATEKATGLMKNELDAVDKRAEPQALQFDRNAHGGAIQGAVPAAPLRMGVKLAEEKGMVPGVARPMIRGARMAPAGRGAPVPQPDVHQFQFDKQREALRDLDAAKLGGLRRKGGDQFGDGKVPPALKRQLGGVAAGALAPMRPRGFGIAGEPQAAFLAQAPPPSPFVVREYAHQRTHGDKKEMRSDFAETLYWHPVLVLPDGKAEVSFELCDSVTTFEVLAYGHTLDGRLGAVTSTIAARLPFTLEPKLPIEVTRGDTIDVPVSIANNTAESRSVNVRVKANGVNLVEGKNPDQLTVAADQRTRRVYRFQPSIIEGEARLEFQGEAQPFAADTISRTFRVVPEGFPGTGSHSDMLEKVAHSDVTLPDSWIKGTLKLQAQVYPSTLADLQKGLEAMLREPNGCFEQTSTSNYPNLLILDYLKESNQAKPEVEQRARDLLDKGYKKLTSFECLNQGANKREGYEWFGGTAPAHEALTAYGLMQFRDMARVYKVDEAMVERTRRYLLASRDGKGGFKRNPQALDTFGRAPDNITNAYIVWSLTESGKDDDITKELTALSEQARTSKDPYFLSLVANSLLNRGKGEEGVALLKTVAGAQKPDGHLDAEKTSITGSGGRSLQVETTALAVLAWLKANRPTDFNVPVQNAVKWLGQQRGGQGDFGSTQSTILALKAVIAYAKANKRTAEGGELTLYLGEEKEPLARLTFAAGARDALTLEIPEPEKHLKPGKNPVRVEITGKNAFPHTVSWSFQTLKPASADNCPVKLTTQLDREQTIEGDTVHLKIAVENTQDKGQGMAVAIVGLPAGLTLPEDMKQLKDLARLVNDGKERGRIDAWETRGRELILYWRDLAPKQKIEVPLDLICRVPGEYSGPASRAYLYYNPDVKCWIEPIKVGIKAKAE